MSADCDVCGTVTVRALSGTAAAAAPPNTTLGEVMKLQGWRIELFWNDSANWFTARTVNLDGHLVPFDDPIGVSGTTPAEALVNLHDAVLEWA